MIVYLSDVLRKREINLIYFAYELGLILGETGFPSRYQDFTPSDILELQEIVAQLIDGSWITDIMQEPDEALYIQSRYEDALCSVRAVATGNFEQVRCSDGSIVRAHSTVRYPGDEKYHGEALAKARADLATIVRALTLDGKGELASLLGAGVSELEGSAK